MGQLLEASDYDKLKYVESLGSTPLPLLTKGFTCHSRVEHATV